VEALGTDTLAYTLLNLMAKLIIWVLPVFLYVKLIDKTEPLLYLKFRSSWRKALIFTLIGVTFYLLCYLAQYGGPHPQSKNLTWNNLINTSFSVGFIEEIVFRGFILQKLAELINFWLANFIAALLFLLIHFPGWLLLGSFRTEFGFGMVAIFFLGFSMGILLKFLAQSGPQLSPTPSTIFARLYCGVFEVKEKRPYGAAFTGYLKTSLAGYNFWPTERLRPE
jgi:membrane protease YdiL (CAAX protease family)